MGSQGPVNWYATALKVMSSNPVRGITELLFRWCTLGDEYNDKVPFWLVSGVGGRRRCWYRAQPRPVLFVVVVVVVVDELSLIVAGPGTRNTVQLGLFRPRGVVAYTNAESGVRKLLEA